MSGRVLITGATSGIGRQLALDYRRAGWQVWGCGRDGERLQELGLAGITPMQFDARDLAVMSGVAATLPSLDLLILNAGNCEYMDVGERFDSELFARVIDTNLTATGHALAAFLPLLGGITACHRQLVGELAAAAASRGLWCLQGGPRLSGGYLAP